MPLRLSIAALLFCFAAACKTPPPAELSVEIRPADAAAGPALKSGDTLKRSAPLSLSVLNASSAPTFLMLFVVDAGERVYWLLPNATPNAQSVQLPNNPSPMKLGPVTLEQATPGKAQVVAFFSDRPLPAMGVNEQVRVGGWNAVRGLDGATVVQSYPLVLE